MISEVEKNERRCPMCGGGLHDQTATLPFVIRNSVVIVKDVAAEVCCDCGEAFTSGEVTDSITAVLQDAVNRGLELAMVSLPEEAPSVTEKM